MMVPTRPVSFSRATSPTWGGHLVPDCCMLPPYGRLPRLEEMIAPLPTVPASLAERSHTVAHSCRSMLGERGPGGTHPASGRRHKEVPTMYSILYIIGAIVVIIVVLRLLGLY